MSILGTCPECLHHTDGMCDLRPRICLNYDHFERWPMVTLARDDFEKLYISRAAYDELNAKVAALRADLEYERHFTDAIRKVEKTLDVYLRQTGGGPAELINGMLKFNYELKEDNAALTAALAAANEDAERLAEDYGYYHDVAGKIVCIHCEGMVENWRDEQDAIIHDADCPIILHRARCAKLEGGGIVMDSPDKEA